MCFISCAENESKKDQFLKKYQMIKQKLGTEKLRLHKIIIFGPSRAGKSTLLKVLLNKLERLDNYQQSTMVLDRVEIKSDATSSTSDWKLMNLNNEIDRLRQIIEAKLPDETLDDGPISINQPDLAVETKLLESVVDNSPTLKSTHLTSKNKTDCAKDRKKVNQLTTLIACYDSGGQAEFFDILPALITVSTGNIMVFDMSKSLHSKLESEYYEKGELWSKSTTHLTTVELMNLALANIQHYSLKSPQCFSEMLSFTNTGDLLVVGTHLDKCGETTTKQKQELIKIDQTICRDVLESSTVRIINRKGTKLTSVIHPIANTCSEGRDAAAQEIRSGIERMSINEHDVPVNWLLFQYEVRLTGKPYISRDECIATAKKCYVKLNENNNEDDDSVDIDDILMYFNELGIFLYYSDIEELKNVIFCDPQWLFRKLTEIIKLKYNPTCQPGKRECLHQGILEVKFLDDEIFTEGFDEDGILTFKHLLKLFEHINIMTKLSDEKFFMPTLLDSAPQGFSLETYGSKIGDTLCIKYENNFFPRGVFCYIVALLVGSETRQQGWHVQFNNAFKNLIVIKLGSNYEYVILHDKLKHIEVEIYDSDDNPQQSHQVVCYTFYEILNTICSKTNLVNHYKSGFSCSTCQKIAVVKLQNPCCPSHLICTGTGTAIGCGTSLMTYNQLMWFISKESLNTIKVNRLNYTHLVIFT